MYVLGFDIGGTKCAVLSALVEGDKVELLKKEKADLLLATDPDSDRVGTAVLDGEGYRLISGNEMGILLLDYICRQRLSNIYPMILCKLPFVSFLENLAKT